MGMAEFRGRDFGFDIHINIKKYTKVKVSNLKLSKPISCEEMDL